MPTTNTQITQKLDRFLGKCAPCVRPIAVERKGVFGDFLRVPCPQCSRPVKLERLYGTETTMTCDPRCEGAVGPTCECACGGANHGGAFLAEGEALATAVARYQAQSQKRGEAAKEAAKTRARNAMSDEERWITEYKGDSSFLLSLQEQAGKGYHLSDRQVAAIRTNMEREARQVAPERPQPKRALHCPEGEGAIIEGKVTSLKTKEMANGPVLQGRVLTTDGWSAWGTIPRALREPKEVEVGDEVSFTATLRRSPDDVFFGFWSYPEGGVFL